MKEYSQENAGKAAYLKKGVFFSLLHGEIGGREAERAAIESGLVFEGCTAMRVCTVCLSENASSQECFQWLFQKSSGGFPFSGEYTVALEFCGNRRMAVLLCGSAELLADSGPAIQWLTKTCTQELEGKQLFLAVGPQVGLLEQLPFSYTEACKAETSLFFLGYGSFSFHGGKGRCLCEGKEIQREFRQALRTGKEEAVRVVLEKLFQILKEREAILTPSLYHFYFSLLWELEEEYFSSFPEKEESRQRQWENDTQSLETMDTMQGFHEFLLARARQVFARKEKWENGNFVVCRVVQLIQQNYNNQELSVKQLAGSVYLTSNYLSCLFRQKTGKTIGEYITEVRIGEAKQLLKAPNLKLYQISRQVGYEDPNYFAKIFKKHVGVTLSEYRAMLGKNDGNIYEIEGDK